MKWFNLNAGLIVLGIIVLLVLAGTIIVGISLWNVPMAKELFPFLEISEVFPTKAIALFTGLATFGTLVLALTTILTIKNNNDQEATRRLDELSKEMRQRDKAELDEIIDWAVDIAKCGIPVESSAAVNAQNIIQEQKYILASLDTLANNFRTLMAKGLYVEKIASVYERMDNGELIKAVNKTCEYLNKQAELIRKSREAVINSRLSEFLSAYTELIDNWNMLSGSAGNVIGVALNIKLVITDI